MEGDRGSRSVGTSESLYVSFPAPGRVEVASERVPDPGPGEVLCRAARSLISTGTETFCLRGVFDPDTNWERWVRYPFRPGYSMAARVVAAGSGVQDFREGDLVGVWAPHQQLFTAPSASLHRIPAGIGPEEAAWAALATTTQLAARRPALQLGETVGIVGLGLLGQLVVQWMSISGARRIVAVDTSSYRLEAARRHGATHTIERSVADARAEVEELTWGRMLDVVFDVTGEPSVLPAALRLLRPQGRLVLLGDSPTPTRQHLAPGVVSDSLSILGVHASLAPPVATYQNPWTRPEMTSLFFETLLQGRMRVDDLVTSRHSPADAPAVYGRLVEDRSREIAVIFDWDLLS